MLGGTTGGIGTIEPPVPATAAEPPLPASRLGPAGASAAAHATSADAAAHNQEIRWFMERSIGQTYPVRAGAECARTSSEAHHTPPLLPYVEGSRLFS
jgi:hypothetical protein